MPYCCFSRLLLMRRTQGGDQAVLNFLLHRLGPKAKLRFKHAMLHHWHSLIHHARYGWPFRVDRFGVLRRHNGSTPAIVHQYDRWTGSQGIFQGRYPHLGAGFFYRGPNASNNTPMARMKNICRLCRQNNTEVAA
jgi:hypothetical protein